MGRYNLAPSTVQKQASALLQTQRLTHPPPWYQAVSQNPPPQILVRQPLQRTQRPGKRSSRLFSPVKVGYEEDTLRWEYFNDHPWELARPRVVLENDGRDRERWDWSVPLDVSLNPPKSWDGVRARQQWEDICERQAGRPLNGEAVIQRQRHLLTHTPLTPAAAYDTARKELYRIRHYRETSTRVAREEALSTGAYFGPGPLEVGMMLEDKAYEDWKRWAEKETDAIKQLQSSAYSAAESEEAEPAGEIEGQAPELEVVEESIPGTKKGVEAKGGEAVEEMAEIAFESIKPRLGALGADKVKTNLDPQQLWRNIYNHLKDALFSAYKLKSLIMSSAEEYTIGFPRTGTDSEIGTMNDFQWRNGATDVSWCVPPRIKKKVTPDSGKILVARVTVFTMPKGTLEG